MSVQPPRKILMPMDNSLNSLYTFDWFLKYFAKDRDQLFFLHCVDPSDKFSMPAITLPPDSGTDIADDSSQCQHPSLESKLRAMLSDNRIKGQVMIIESKNPGECIVKTLESHKIDIILMGTRGEGGAPQKGVGRVCDYVMYHALVPTLVVSLPPADKLPTDFPDKRKKFQ